MQDYEKKKGLKMKLNVTSEGNSSLRQIQLALGVIGMACLLVLINGCASGAVSEEPDPYTYNPTTDYPLVGGPSMGDL